jgi:hypothetical protein
VNRTTRTENHIKKRARTIANCIAAGKKRFLKHLRQCGIVGAAAARAGIGRTVVYDWRNTDEAFANKWDEALELAYDDLEASILERAKNGSDTLAIFAAKAQWPDKYRERVDIRNHPDIKRIALGFADILRRHVPLAKLRDVYIEICALTGHDPSSDPKLATALQPPNGSPGELATQFERTESPPGES